MTCINNNKYFYENTVFFKSYLIRKLPTHKAVPLMIFNNKKKKKLSLNKLNRRINYYSTIKYHYNNYLYIFSIISVYYPTSNFYIHIFLFLIDYTAPIEVKKRFSI